MNILFTYSTLIGNFSGRNKDFFIHEVARQTPCKLAGKGFPDYVEGENIRQIIKRLYGEGEPDWVIGVNVNSRTIGMNYGLARWIGDLHVNPDKLLTIANNQFDLLFLRVCKARYYFPTLEDFYAVFPIPPENWVSSGHLVEAEESYWTDQMKIPTRFFPVGIEDSHYTPRPENEKIYDVSLIASIGNFYPLRLAISKEIEDLGKEHGWNVLLRRAPNDPDYRRDISKIHADAELRKEWLVGTDYAEALTRSKIFIFGSSIFRYPVAKYLEGLMSECLVMADRPFHAEDLHLKDGFNYVEITRDNWKEKLEYYLDDDQLRETIARHGRETAIKYHTNKVRAAEFIQMLREVQH